MFAVTDQNNIDTGLGRDDATGTSRHKEGDGLAITRLAIERSRARQVKGTLQLAEQCERVFAKPARVEGQSVSPCRMPHRSVSYRSLAGNRKARL